MFEDFCKKYSCESTLIKSIVDWKLNLDSNQMIGTVFLDIWEDLDSWYNGFMIAELRAYGLSRNACDFFSAALSVICFKE